MRRSIFTMNTQALCPEFLTPEEFQEVCTFLAKTKGTLDKETQLRRLLGVLEKKTPEARKYHMDIIRQGLSKQ